MSRSESPRGTGRQNKKKGVPGASRPTGTPVRIKKEDPPGIPPRDSTGGSSDVECGGALLSHTLSSAVPSPRPGLSFRVRKGTGRLTWAMTTAKPIHSANPPEDRPATEPATIPIVAVREPDNGREAKRLTSIVVVTTRKQCSLPSNEKTTTGRDPTHQTRVGKCAAFAR